MLKFIAGKEPALIVITEIRRPKSPDGVLVLRAGKEVILTEDEYGKIIEGRLVPNGYLKPSVPSAAPTKTADQNQAAKPEVESPLDSKPKA